MKTGTATATIEIHADVIGRFERADYGVERSPVWDELSDVELDGPVTINGADYDVPKLRDMFGEKGAAKLLALISETAAEVGNWRDAG